MHWSSSWPRSLYYKGRIKRAPKSFDEELYNADRNPEGLCLRSDQTKFMAKNSHNNGIGVWIGYGAGDFEPKSDWHEDFLLVECRERLVMLALSKQQILIGPLDKCVMRAESRGLVI